MPSIQKGIFFAQFISFHGQSIIAVKGKAGQTQSPSLFAPESSEGGATFAERAT
jgi:hypothetical protein